MTTTSRQAHPAGRRRQAALVDPWALDREAARTEVWRRRYWMTVTGLCLLLGLTLWVLGLALIVDVVR
jgi:hypothetical protein